MERLSLFFFKGLVGETFFIESQMGANLRVAQLLSS